MSADPPAPSSKKTRRTWPQRLTIVTALLAATACFAAAGALYAGQRVVEDRNLVQIVNPADTADVDADANFESNGETPPSDPQSDAATDDPEAGAEEEAPVETFPSPEPDAKNFLITGADNNSCIDPDSPYAPAFGDRTNFGERSDTLMMWRVNPAESQVAVLSFPRDLWVTIPGRAGKQRINVAYERGSPQKLIDTIYQNFGIATDHFIQVDFCAFKTLVDAVDGVKVPFANAIRDQNTGLNVPQPGCFNFDGDHALAYVRSRKLDVLVDGEWQRDESSDLGRISRQQDFIRRVADELLAAGAFSPEIVGGLVETSSEYLVLDSELTTRKILEFAGVLRSLDPGDITTYQIEADPTNVQGNAVLIPRLGGENMSAILSVFQGLATLASAPDQLFETDEATSGGDSGDQPPATAASGDPATTTVAPALPEVEAEQIVYGYVPDPTVRC
jgi:LCP family protein required for cell wall assembly